MNDFPKLKDLNTRIEIDLNFIKNQKSQYEYNITYLINMYYDNFLSNYELCSLLKLECYKKDKFKVTDDLIKARINSIIPLKLKEESKNTLLNIYKNLNYKIIIYRYDLEYYSFILSSICIPDPDINVLDSKYNLENLKYNLEYENKSEDNTINLLDKYISNTKILKLIRKNIKGILDLNKFTELEVLNCEFNEITSIINIPKTLKKLFCSHNKINKLDDLPDSLQILSCSNNLINSLDYLPSNVRILDCSNNLIKTLDKLKRTECDQCKDINFISINGCDCCRLNSLNCSFNNIEKLDKLPNCLQELFCNNNKIREIDNFPNKIKILDCSHNLITDITKLPEHARDVNLDFNYILNLNFNIESKNLQSLTYKNNFINNYLPHKLNFYPVISKKIYCPNAIFRNVPDFHNCIID